MRGLQIAATARRLRREMHSTRPPSPMVSLPNLRRARERADVTQELLTEQLKIPRPTLTGYERGMRAPEPVALALAEVLCVPLSELMGEFEGGRRWPM